MVISYSAEVKKDQSKERLLPGIDAMKRLCVEHLLYVPAAIHDGDKYMCYYLPQQLRLSITTGLLMADLWSPIQFRYD